MEQTVIERRMQIAFEAAQHAGYILPEPVIILIATRAQKNSDIPGLVHWLLWNFKTFGGTVNFANAKKILDLIADL